MTETGCEPRECDSRATHLMNILQCLGGEETGRCPKQKYPMKTEIAINKSWTRSSRVSALRGVEKQRVENKRNTDT